MFDATHTHTNLHSYLRGELLMELYYLLPPPPLHARASRLSEILSGAPGRRAAQTLRAATEGRTRVRAPIPLRLNTGTSQFSGAVDNERQSMQSSEHEQLHLRKCWPREPACGPEHKASKHKLKGQTHLTGRRNVAENGEERTNNDARRNPAPPNVMQASRVRHQSLFMVAKRYSNAVHRATMFKPSNQTC